MTAQAKAAVKTALNPNGFLADTNGFNMKG
jgi:hypothetical protein